ncbi:MAG: DNA alkylation repair protein [Pirellulaceae bacterium]
MTAREAQIRLRALANPQQAAISARFFKTGPGEYGAGDVFRGIKVPVIRRVAKDVKFKNLPLPEVELLLHSKIHYAFPHLRNFVFLCGSDDWSSDSKFLFFNAEPILDVSWSLYAGPHLDRMRKSLALQQRYADCFASDAPEMDVPTERSGVVANRFPGHGRTAWTLYNARYTTVRGTVLAVEHREGTSYRDLWNDRVLTPEIREGKAFLAVTLEPQGLGCVVQEMAR